MFSDNHSLGGGHHDGGMDDDEVTWDNGPDGDEVDAEDGSAAAENVREVPPELEADAERCLEQAQIVADTRGEIASLEATVIGLESKAKWMDRLDVIISAIPGLGDEVSAMMGLYILAEAIGAGVPKKKLALMIINIGLDALAGMAPIPGVGILLDLFYRSNRFNVRILREHLNEKKAKAALTPGQSEES
jgi:hypothetical protein